MTINAMCPACGMTYRLRAATLGQRLRCRKCRETFQVTVMPSEKAPFPVALFAGSISAVVVLLAGAGVLGLWLTQRTASEATAPAQPGAAVAALVDRPANSAPQALANAASSRTTIPLTILEELKNATVFVKVTAGILEGSGSGFLLRTEGDNGYVVTNHHVISPPQDAGPFGFRSRARPFGHAPLFATAPPSVTLVFGSGTANERALHGEIVASDKERDLALLRVKGLRDLPRPIDLSWNPQLVETMPVFILGFPFGDALTTNKSNPAITVSKGSVSSIRLDERGELALIQIDGDLNPGNSGGPVVDLQGRLVGIAVAKVKNTQIGLAIPPAQLVKMFTSRKGL
jgi:S1-C subfamily serine protease